MSLLPPLSAPIFIRTAVLIFTFFWMVSGSPAHSQTAARFISNQQWEAEVQFTFNPKVRDREPKIDRLLADQLLKKLKVQRVTYDLRKQVGLDGGLTYGLKFQGIEGWGQFRRALFTVTDPTTPFTDGPALLELIGSVKPGEPLALDPGIQSGQRLCLGNSNPGRAEIETGGSHAISTHGERAGGFYQANYFSGKGWQGEKPSVRLLYRRPWIKSQAPQMEITLRAAEISLISDLSNPDPPLDQPLYSADQKAPLSDTPVLGLPASFDWRDSGILTPVRDQGNCGSCWAFGTVGPFEANLKWKSSLTTDLSEEFLLSCNTDGYSCNGGWWAHEYHYNQTAINQTQPGAVLEADFPLRGGLPIL